MSRNVLAAALIAAVAGAGLTAQDQTAGSQGQARKKITVTGCVERADQVASRENLGTTVDSLSYVLIKAEEGAADQTQNRTPAAADSRPADEKGLGKAYRLAVDTDTMNPHVGHRVEIVGSVAEQAAGAQPVGTSGSLPAGENVGAESPVLQVESVKMLSSTCPRE